MIASLGQLAAHRPQPMHRSGSMCAPAASILTAPAGQTF